MRYWYVIDFSHGISVFANFSCGIAVLGTPNVPLKKAVFNQAALLLSEI